jgi:hypothetical protein
LDDDHPSWRRFPAAGEYQATAVLLAIAVGRPSYALGAFNAILDASDSDEPLYVIAGAHAPSVVEWQNVRELMYELMKELSTYKEMASYKKWAIEISRYSFHTQEIWRRYANSSRGR